MARRVDLSYREGSSDKVYNLALERFDDGDVRVSAAYGRRGGVLKIDVKYSGASAEAAAATFDRLLREKTGKGYSVVASADPPAGFGDLPRQPAARAKVAQGAWLPTDLEPAEVEGMFTDSNMVGQEKADGIHILAERTATGLVGMNRHGTERGISPEVRRALMSLPEGSVVDGEQLHTGPLVLFDMLQFGAVDLRDRPYADRFRAVETFVGALDPANQDVIQVVRSACGSIDKRDLCRALLSERAEGIIFKALDAPYRVGRPTRGGTMRRLKFLKRAEVVLTRRTGDAKASFEMTVYDDVGREVNVGSVSARGFLSSLQPGAWAVGEVEYLYGTASGKLVQPVFVRFRDDKVRAACTQSQIIVSKRFDK